MVRAGTYKKFFIVRVPVHLHSLEPFFPENLKMKLIPTLRVYTQHPLIIMGITEYKPVIKTPTLGETTDNNYTK